MGNNWKLFPRNPWCASSFISCLCFSIEIDSSWKLSWLSNENYVTEKLLGTLVLVHKHTQTVQTNNRLTSTSNKEKLSLIHQNESGKLANTEYRFLCFFSALIRTVKQKHLTEYFRLSLSEKKKLVFLKAVEEAFLSEILFLFEISYNINTSKQSSNSIVRKRQEELSLFQDGISKKSFDKSFFQSFLFKNLSKKKTSRKVVTHIRRDVN